jgi:Protein of unknown function (DUF2924)
MFKALRTGARLAGVGLASVGLAAKRKTEPPTGTAAAITAGSELVRTWKGKTYRVRLAADGFAYAGKTFAGLSEIATEIAGCAFRGIVSTDFSASCAAISEDREQRFQAIVSTVWRRRCVRTRNRNGLLAVGGMTTGGRNVQNRVHNRSHGCCARTPESGSF